MRRLASLAAIGLLVAACGGSGSTASQAPGATTARLPATTTAPLPGATTAPATSGGGQPAGGTAATVVLTGGANPGTFTMSGDPNCSDGLVPGSYGVQLSDATITAAGQLSSVQVILPKTPASGSDTTLLITLGPILSGVNYNVSGVSGGTASGTFTPNGSGAVIHVTGTTKDGVGIDATVNCPSVIKGS